MKYNYPEIVNNHLKAYEKMGRNNKKIHFLHFHLEYFPNIWENVPSEMGFYNVSGFC